MRGEATGLAASGGVARAALQPRASRAADAFAACALREARSRGPDALPGPVRVTVTVEVRDRRLDGVRREGGPSWLSRCDASLSGAFQGDLPEAEDTEYSARFEVALSPER